MFTGGGDGRLKVRRHRLERGEAGVAGAEVEQREGEAGKVLLVAELLIGCDEHVEPRLRGGTDEAAVGEAGYAHLAGVPLGVAGEQSLEVFVNKVVEQDLHRIRKPMERAHGGEVDHGRGLLTGHGGGSLQGTHSSDHRRGGGQSAS